MDTKAQKQLVDALIKLAQEKGYEANIDHLLNLQEELSAPPIASISPHFPRRSLKELRSLPPKPWLVDQIFGPGDLGVIYGPSGCGKTFIVIDMIIKFCLGKRWAFRFDVHKPLHVAYCAGEGYSGLASRFNTACMAHNVEDLDNFSFFDTVPQLFNPESEESYISFINQCQQRHIHIDLLIIDTFHSAINDADENFSKEMGSIIRATQTISKTLGCAILLVHHTNKEEMVERGSSSLRASADFMISIKKDEKLGGTNSIMSCSKNKDGEMWKSQNFNLSPVDDCDSVYVTWDTIDSDENAKKNNDWLKDKIYELIRTQPDNQFKAKFIAGALDADLRKVQKLLKELNDEDKINIVLDQNTKSNIPNPQLYSYKKGIFS